VSRTLLLKGGLGFGSRSSRVSARLGKGGDGDLRTAEKKGEARGVIQKKPGLFYLVEIVTKRWESEWCGAGRRGNGHKKSSDDLYFDEVKRRIEKEGRAKMKVAMPPKGAASGGSTASSLNTNPEGAETARDRCKKESVVKELRWSRRDNWPTKTLGGIEVGLRGVG